MPDLRGHGRSTNPSKQFTHRQSALDVYALLDALGIKQFKAMGISTGGMTLIHMATQEPPRVEAMVLIGVTIYFPEQARALMRVATIASLTPDTSERRRKIHQRGDEQIRELQQQFHAFKDSYGDMNFTGPYLSTITARTVDCARDRDQFFPLEIPLEMYRSIPNALLWIIPKGSHVPIFDPWVPFIPTALKFLSGWQNNQPKPTSGISHSSTMASNLAGAESQDCLRLTRKKVDRSLKRISELGPQSASPWPGLRDLDA